MSQSEDGVFTTLAWDGERRLCAYDLHIQRLKRHSKKLGIDWPEKFNEEIAERLEVLQDENFPSQKSLDYACRPPALVSIELHRDSNINVYSRTNSHNLLLDKVEAITIAAPSRKQIVLGIKKLDWGLYRGAMNTALSHDVDAALIVQDGAIIDGDRATPMLLLADGTVWVSSHEQGAVDSITLEILSGEMQKKGFPLCYGLLKPNMFIEAVEAVLVGTGMGVCALKNIDGREIGAGTLKLVNGLREILQTEMDKRWMTFEEVIKHH